MKKKILFLGGILCAAVACFAVVHLKKPADELSLKLYGNVDVRQISLAFERAGRILDVLVEEGDRVEKGQLLARMDVRSLQLQSRKLEAEIAAQEQNLLKMRNGSRPEEIRRAEAVLKSAEASLVQARRNDSRMEKLRAQNSISQQERENAQTALRVAIAQKDEAKQALALLRAGFRAEDRAMAAAQLDASRASLDMVRHDISQGELFAPTTAVVSSRLLEPGDMAASNSPVLQLSLTSPKWIRAYASETQLGRIRHGMPVSIQTDSFPEAIMGQVGYISPTAEFTPKSVQTEELRTTLLYEIRIVTNDTQDRLRLGMPVTVFLHENDMAGTGHVR